MKKLFLTVIWASISFLCSAQTLCGLEIEKGEKVNYYHLNFGKDIFTLNPYKATFQWPVPNEVDFENTFQLLSKKLKKDKFKFDPKEDTILITETYDILRVYTKNKQYNYSYSYSYSNNCFKLRKYGHMLSENMQKADQAIYNGDFLKVKGFIEKQGYIITRGAGFAIRIIIKYGKIQYPVDLWRYYTIV